MCIHLYLLIENSAKHFSNLMNLGEIYIFLYQQLESGKRLFDTFLTIKKIWHLDLNKTIKCVKLYVVIIKHKKWGPSHF